MGKGARQCHVCTLTCTHRHTRTYTNPSFWDSQAAGLLLSMQAPALGNTKVRAPQKTRAPGAPQSLRLSGLSTPHTHPEPPCLTSPSPPSCGGCRGPGKDLKFMARPPIELTGRLFAQFSSPFRPEAGREGSSYTVPLP